MILKYSLRFGMMRIMEIVAVIGCEIKIKNDVNVYSDTTTDIKYAIVT